jgi:hypothetical protein
MMATATYLPVRMYSSLEEIANTTSTDTQTILEEALKMGMLTGLMSTYNNEIFFVDRHGNKSSIRYDKESRYPYLHFPKSRSSLHDDSHGCVIIRMADVPAGIMRGFASTKGLTLQEYVMSSIANYIQGREIQEAGGHVVIGENGNTVRCSMSEAFYVGANNLIS